MCVFRETVPQGVVVDYQTRYGVMRLRGVRADGMGELQAVKGTMTLFAPINGLGKPSVMLEEEKIGDEVVNESERVVDDTKNDNNDTKNDNNDAKINNTNSNTTEATTNPTTTLSGVGSDIGSSDDEMAEVSLFSTCFPRCAPSRSWRRRR